MDALGVESAVLIGNSAGGTVAALTALAYPERVDALVFVDAAIYVGGGSPPFLRPPLLATPQMRHLGRCSRAAFEAGASILGAPAWHNPDPGSPASSGRTLCKPLRVENWDRALWELTAASRRPDVAGQLDQLTLPVLMITGDDDRIVPTEQVCGLPGSCPMLTLWFSMRAVTCRRRSALSRGWRQSDAVLERAVSTQALFWSASKGSRRP